MLLVRSVASGVEIVAVCGPVAASDVDALIQAVARAVALSPRGVLLDLSEATSIVPEALAAIGAARATAPGWPRPALHVCCTSVEVRAALQAAVPVHDRLEDGFAHVDDRSPSPRHRIELDSSPQSPARARAMTAGVVADLHLEALGDDLALVVSELVTNAIRYAEPPVELEIQADDDAVTVAVADGSPGRPAAQAAADDAEGGRGLTLIDHLATETGVRPRPPGKTVWAALNRR